MPELPAAGSPFYYPAIIQAVTVYVVNIQMVGQVDNFSVHLNTDSLFPNPKVSACIISVCTLVDVPFVLI